MPKKNLLSTTGKSMFTEFLAKLESRSTTRSGKACIEAIRRAYDMLDDDGQFDDDDDFGMSEEDKLSNRYGTSMQVTGEEAVRTLDPDVRAEEDMEDEDERLNQEYEESDERIAERNNENREEIIRRLSDPSEYEDIKNYLAEDLAYVMTEFNGYHLYHQYKHLVDEGELGRCIVPIIKKLLVDLPVTVEIAHPKVVNGKTFIGVDRKQIKVPAYVSLRINNKPGDGRTRCAYVGDGCIPNDKGNTSHGDTCTFRPVKTFRGFNIRPQLCWYTDLFCEDENSHWLDALDLYQQICESGELQRNVERYVRINKAPKDNVEEEPEINNDDNDIYTDFEESHPDTFAAEDIDNPYHKYD